MPKIKGDHTETYTIDSVGKSYKFAKNYEGESGGYYVIDEEGRDNEIIFHGIGKSSVNFDVIHSEGVETEIRIAEDGVITGQGNLIYTSGLRATITNDGELRPMGTFSAIAAAGDNSRVTNNGTIYTETGSGIAIGNGGVGTNAKHGVIHSKSYAVTMASDEGGTAKFINEGKIYSIAEYAVTGSAGRDTLINHGKIEGSMLFGEGRDIIDIRGGTVIGEIQAGAGDDVIDIRDGRVTGSIVGASGDDVLITDDATIRLREGSDGGNDTIRSTVSYTLNSADYVENLTLLGNKKIDGFGTSHSETLTGNGGKNLLSGRGGGDLLDGRGGNDKLNGSAGWADTFRFKTGYDHDKIIQFDVSDVIDIRGWKAVRNFADLQDHMKTRDGDTTITYGHDSLTIANVDKHDLLSTDFML